MLRWEWRSTGENSDENPIGVVLLVVQTNFFAFHGSFLGGSVFFLRGTLLHKKMPFLRRSWRVGARAVKAAGSGLTGGEADGLDRRWVAKHSLSPRGTR
jgi:hypothetical protein